MSLTSEEPEVVSPAELMNLREHYWSRKLAAVSLVAEVPIDSELTEQTLGVLGRIYRLRRPKGDQGRFLQRWPAVQVLSTVGVATEHYAHGTFWPRLAELAGVDQDQNFQREWGTAYLENLATLGLPVFEDSDDAGSAYVGRILLHSGVPTYCLPDYMRLVQDRRRRSPGLDAESFVSWAVEARLSNVDKPVVRFLKFGGEFAVDVSDRIFELMDVVATGGDGTAVPLPERFRVVAHELAAAGEIDRLAPGKRATRPQSSAETHPHLVLDPYGRGLLLRLPAISEAPDGMATWLVSIDERTQHVRTQALWPGSGEPAPQTDVAVTSPARTATAALEGHEQLQATVGIVDDKDPLLAFDEEGLRLQPGLPWRGTATWLLMPGEADQLEVHGDLRIMTEAPLPPGWAGWSLVLADLGDVSSLAFGASGKRHSIQRFSSARIALPEPVDGVRTRSGEPVFAAPPAIELPPEFGVEAVWDVTVLDSRGETLDRRSVSSDAAADDIWSSLPSPLFGRYSIKVRGPWGRGASRDMVIIESFSAESSPAWRRLRGGGLVPATVRISTHSRMEADHSAVSLSADETRASVSVVHEGRSILLSLEPAHMSLSYQAADGLLGPTVRPLSLYAEDIIEAPGMVTVNVGAAAAPVLHVFKGPQHLQAVEPGGNSRYGVHRFDLRRIVDTLREHPQIRLCLDPEGRLDVVGIRPRKLFSNVVLGDGGLLSFEDCVEVDGLTALLYATRAPWRAPVQIPVVSGKAQLRPEMQDAGPLVLMVRVEDPWVPEPVPSWPAEGQSRIVRSRGYLRSDDEEETALSAFLAGEAEAPERIADLARVWSVLARPQALLLDDRFSTIKAMVALVSVDPVESLQALAQSSAPTESLPSMLIRSGLAAAPCTGTIPSAVGLDWSRRSVIGSVLLLPLLVPSEREEALEAAAITCGEVVADIACGKDPSPSAGRFDESADRYDLLDDETRTLFKAQAAFMPRGILDADTRSEAAMRLLETRREHDLGLIVPRGRRLYDEMRRLFSIIGTDDALEALESRRHPTNPSGWRIMPALSIGFAFVARYAARGSKIASDWSTRERKAWGQLSRATPDLALADIILAELIVASREGLAQEGTP